MFFSHPGDFTPVCTTELGRVAQLEDELSMRNVKSLGLSADSIESHLAWIDDINDSQGTDFFVPMIADENRLIAHLYGMLHLKENGVAPVRQLYIIDSSKTIRFSATYPVSVGRNFCEILRVIDALRLTDHQPVNTPADWWPGDPAIISPSLGNKIAAQVFPQGWTEVLPYLRNVEPA
jgi:peroxiredoxin (alkyl hydroperoxide reductase subunit C)